MALTFNGQVFAALEAALKTVYTPGVTELSKEAPHIVYEKLIPGAVNYQINGKEVQVTLQTKGISSEGFAGELDDFEEPDKTGYGKATTQIVRAQATGGITMLADLTTKTNQQSQVQALVREQQNVRAAHDRTLARGIHSTPAGDVATIATGGVAAGSGTDFTLTLTNANALFYGRGVVEGAKVLLGSVDSAGVGTAVSGKWYVVSLDEDASTLTIDVQSGSPATPVAGQKVFVGEHSVNNGINGLPALYNQSDSFKFENLAPNDLTAKGFNKNLWKAYSQALGGAITWNVLSKHLNVAKFKAREDGIADIGLTGAGIHRTVCDDLADQVRFTSDEVLQGSSRVKLPNGVELEIDPCTPTGAIRFLSSKHVGKATDGPAQYVPNAAGGNIHRIQRSPRVEWYLVQHLNLVWDKRNAYSEITGITGDTSQL